MIKQQKIKEFIGKITKLFSSDNYRKIIVALGIAGYNWFLQTKITHNQEIGDSFVQLISDESKDTKLLNDLLKEIEINNKSKLSELASIKLVSQQIKLHNYKLNSFLF